MMATTQDKIISLNRIAGHYEGKTILITGASGFVGQTLVEKILRTCPLVKRIYIIIRAKKGKDPQERFKQLFNGPIFGLLKETRGVDIINKVTAIDGEISEMGLRLTPENRKILAAEVEMIFHLAATTRFEEPFKKAVLINARGTKSLLDLAKECKKLLVFAHVSTAFCHPHEKVLYEKTYPAPADPDVIIKLVELYDDDVIESMASALKGKSPNTYTFTKALAEGLISNEMDTLPVIIFRPSVIMPIWKDPLPGWTNNIGGPVGLLIAAGKGVLRTMYCDPNGYIDFIPADIVVNGIILSAYDFMHVKERRVFHLTSSSVIKVTWNELIETGRKIVETRIPLNWVVWYPGGSIKTSKWVHKICAIFFHYIPAIFLDFLIILTGNKPVLWNIQQRIAKGSELFEYYATNVWEFNNENGLAGRATFNDTEKQIYKVDEQGFDIEEYFYKCIHATRLYLLKESDESIPTARRHMKIMWAVDKLCKFLMLIYVGYLVLKYIICPVIGLDF